MDLGKQIQHKITEYYSELQLSTQRLLVVQRSELVTIKYMTLCTVRHPTERITNASRLVGSFARKRKRATAIEGCQKRQTENTSSLGIRAKMPNYRWKPMHIKGEGGKAAIAP
ncbi:uncharacterized protein MCYG_08243 [Microsporum canis CBS 113480]|uniref:Uncharacterized protein n=1 Tax=Arthroderma otae (strain ATCC MYA-4605 / CBS 113480) TaxID=554155 RepID=C5FZX1_ARTOC|nr:uncharacterized protein MCYG_08243 [Microsporum canis CBS 113480]EEQ35424.1 predicted protein [Microsporum canis CBS 113480]